MAIDTLTFDTHEIIKTLRDKGMTEELAEYQVEAMKDVVRQAVSQVQHEFELDDVVTNRDLDARIKETELKIEQMRSELKRDLAETKADLQRWVVTVVFGVGVLQTAIMAALLLRLVGKV